MKTILSTHESIELEPGFEPPQPFLNNKSLFASRIHRFSTDRDYIGLKLMPGVGLWTPDGRLCRYLESSADLGIVESSYLLTLENRFSTSTHQNMVRHALVKRRLEDFEPITELAIDIPLGGCEYLVLSPDKKLAISTWLDQAEWGYVAIDLESWKCLSLRFEWPTATISPPEFSPNGEYIAACNYFRSIWWADEDADWYDSSPGGQYQVGVITLQNTITNTVESHPLFVVVSPGWLPDDPEDPYWGMVWGPEWLTPDSFRIWLPDNTPEILTLPLPQQLVIQRPLSDRRVDSQGNDTRMAP